MRDPFLIPPLPVLSRAVEPLAERYGMPTLPLHIHEVILSALLYTFVHLVVSPALSRRLAPAYYPTSRGKRANWDSHVVSLFQSVLVNALALWVMFTDEERKHMDWQQRIWGYTGSCGMIQAFATGYFVWDLITTLLYLDVFGLGLLAHAGSALAVFSLGYRPFLNYYAPVFILYELSTPFLNIHWFFDKLGMTGSMAQLVNGLTLLGTFFGCRLVWGTTQSLRVYYDMYRALRATPSAGYASAAHANATLTDATEVMSFATDASPIPVWLAVTYVTSNIILNSLNWHWFVKMIAAVKKRFEPAKDVGKEKVGADGPTAATTATERLGALRKRSPTDLVPTSDEMEIETMQ